MLPPPSRPTVLIADDHIVWRRGLRDVLEPAFAVVAEASRGNEAVQKALAARPDVVTMDISLPDMDGIAAAARIRNALPSTGIVILSAFSDDKQVDEAIRAGINSYLVKEDSPEAILEAIARAAEGQAYLPPQIATRVLQSLRSGNRAGDGGIGLSHRETTVLRLVAEGRRHKEIARELGISIRTVGNHVSNIYNKLGIDDRAQAIVYAIKKGIVSL